MLNISESMIGRIDPHCIYLPYLHATNDTHPVSVHFSLVKQSIKKSTKVNLHNRRQKVDFHAYSMGANEHLVKHGYQT